jgi:hypothetical protein
MVMGYRLNESRVLESDLMAVSALSGLGYNTGLGFKHNSNSNKGL